MLEIKRDDKGNILAVLEWHRVNDNIEITPYGKGIYLKWFEVNPSERNNGVIKYFIKTIIKKNPQAEWCYFKDWKYGKRPRKFHKRVWLNRIKE